MAVKKYQRMRGLDEDGRFGFATIGKLDLDFAAFTLPSARTDPWSMSCILKICAVEQKLGRKHPAEVRHRDLRFTRVSGGDVGRFDLVAALSPRAASAAVRIWIPQHHYCEQMAFVIYHEGGTGSSLRVSPAFVELERDAYVNADAMVHRRGHSRQPDFTTCHRRHRKLPHDQGHRAVVDEAVAERFVRKNTAA